MSCLRQDLETIRKGQLHLNQCSKKIQGQGEERLGLEKRFTKMEKGAAEKLARMLEEKKMIIKEARVLIGRRQQYSKSVFQVCTLGQPEFPSISEIRWL